MGNRLVVFPVGKEAEGLAYQAWSNAEGRNPFHPDPFAYCRNDAFGQWVVPYLGPPFTYDNVEVPEPEGGEVARADGVLVDMVTWPGDE